MVKINAWEFVKAFEKNCPRLRMNKEERNELSRLFFECQKASTELKDQANANT